jgi:hypothetical protein
MPAKQYATEAELCAALIKHNSEKWTAYPETSGFDILMVRKADGFQIGVEAKLSLNAKVILQAIEPPGHWWANESGPDCRAVLVPWKAKGSDLAALLNRLCVTAIYFGKRPRNHAATPGIMCISNRDFLMMENGTACRAGLRYVRRDAANFLAMFPM